MKHLLIACSLIIITALNACKKNNENPNDPKPEDEEIETPLPEYYFTLKLNGKKILIGDPNEMEAYFFSFSDFHGYHFEVFGFVKDSLKTKNVHEFNLSIFDIEPITLSSYDIPVKSLGDSTYAMNATINYIDSLSLLYMVTRSINYNNTGGIKKPFGHIRFDSVTDSFIKGRFAGELHQESDMDDMVIIEEGEFRMPYYIKKNEW